MIKWGHPYFYLIMLLFCGFFCFFSLFWGCGSDDDDDDTAPTATLTPTPGAGTPTATPTQGGEEPTPTPDTRDLIVPEDLHYLGAFRLPEPTGGQDWAMWDYGGQAMTYYPSGDSGGSGDGYPGSLFGTGNEQYNYVSEISIPAPSLSRNYGELNTATTLQSFHDVQGGLFNALIEMPRMALCYLPALGSQSTGKLYMALSQHLIDESTTVASHGWCDLTLSSPNTQGAWWVGNESPYSTAGYLCQIPQEWADGYTSGRSLGTGRFRDGGMSGMGPALFAIAPWQAGNPPSSGTHLDYTTLLLYSKTTDDDPNNFHMNGYHNSDEWEGAAWVTTSEKQGVLFLGTKGQGYHWYGYYSPNGDGMPCVDVNQADLYCFTPEGDPCPEALMGYCEGHDEPSRGWWSSTFDATILFYDPADLAAVANGTMEPYEPQPYATLNIDPNLFLNHSTDFSDLGYGDQRRYRLGEVAYDRERNLLYVLERFGDITRPVVHVWRIDN